MYFVCNLWLSDDAAPVEGVPFKSISEAFFEFRKAGTKQKITQADPDLLQ